MQKLHLGVVVGLLSWFCIRSSFWLTNCLQHKRSKVSRSVLQSSLHCPGFSFSNDVFSLNFGFSQILYLKAALLGAALISSGNLFHFSTALTENEYFENG